MQRSDILGLILTLVLAGCRPAGPAGGGGDEEPAAWDRSIPLADRVGRDTGGESWRVESRRDDLAAYHPTAGERRTIAECLGRLPPLHKELLAEHLYAIHFLRYLESPRAVEVTRTGPGGGRLGYALVFNPDCLSSAAADYLIRQETRYYDPGHPWTLLKIDCGEDLPAFQYVLLREATRLALACLEQGPPPARQGAAALREAFRAGAWKGNGEPACLALAGAGLRAPDPRAEPVETFDKAVDVYRALSGSRLASLRAAASPEEDVVEFVAFYHLTHKMGCFYRVRITHDLPKEELWLAWEPMKRPDPERVRAVESLFYAPPQPAEGGAGSPPAGR